MRNFIADFRKVEKNTKVYNCKIADKKCLAYVKLIR